MKGKRRLSGVLLIIAALIIMQLPVSEADAATSASDFKMDGSTLVKYRGTETNVSIPNTVEIIGESAFEGNETVELVVVPNSVVQIEPYAFWGCDNLDTVVLGKGLTEVGDFSFANCKGLKQMTIPTSVKNIGIQAFADCVNMTDITIPDEVVSIHETAFDGCGKLVIHCEAGSMADLYARKFYERQKEMPEYEDVPDYQNPDVTDDDSNGTGTDDQSGSDTQTVPDTQPAYEPVIVDDGNILGSTKIVGNQAVVFINNTSLYVLAGGDIAAEIAAGENPDISMPEVAVSSGIPKFTIVDGKIVADQAYYKSTALGQVTLPQGIEEIGQFAFARSTVTDVVLPEGVKDICYGAFYHCDNLRTVILPTTIENVEPKTFTHTLWVDDFMQNGSGDFLISGNVLVAYRGSGEEVTIPEGVTVIAGEAFLNQTEIKSVTFPESLLTVGEGAFEGCSNLTNIQTGEGLLKVKDRAFAGCPLGSVSLPDSVSEVGLKAFDENVDIVYESGQTPMTSHEVSAERLSNEKYRGITGEDTQAQVTVTGVQPAAAHLEGANRSYTLSVKIAEDQSPMWRAYERYYRTAAPGAMTVYDLQLTDNSGIPLTKLGKQLLTVTVPIQGVFSQENVKVITVDRNGQLEQVEAERVLLDGVDAVRFQTSHPSLFGIYGDGSAYDGEEIIEVSTTLQSMSEGPNADQKGLDYMTCLKWSLGGILLLLGTLNVLIIRKRS